jgi:hypothetical protein
MPRTGCLRGVRTADYNLETMYDALRSRYTFACPTRGESHVSLSAFRELERLPGASHPAVYRIRFSCPCGDDHLGFVTHDELDWAPLGLASGVFLNLMTSRIDPLEAEFGDLAARKIEAGQWPWSFFCWPEEQPRPVFPSAFFLLAPGEDALGLAVRCPACGRVSVNLVSSSHVDVPFHHDAEIGVVQHVFTADAEHTVAEFEAELYSARFDSRRLTLEQ